MLQSLNAQDFTDLSTQDGRVPHCALEHLFGEDDIGTDASAALNRRAASASLVLLQNPASTLPLAPGGRVILSGLLNEQAAEVIAVYSELGNSLEHHEEIGDWSTLTMSKSH